MATTTREAFAPSPRTIAFPWDDGPVVPGLFAISAGPKVAATVVVHSLRVA
jgi:hypothetical protein